MARTQDTNRGLQMLTAPEPFVLTEQPIVELPALAALAARRDAAYHPRLNEFKTWMRAAKAGARTCPRGAFPDNFLFWLDGGRW